MKNKPEEKPLAVTILSGGVDSATLAFYMKHTGYEQLFLSFDYGQRHVKELSAAKKIAKLVDDDAAHYVIDLKSAKHVLCGSALTDNIAVPEGHYAKENMSTTVVPNRNAIMLSVAYGAAVAACADALAYGAHAGDHFIYPDCRPNFVDALSAAFALGNEGFGSRILKIHAPFINWKKSDIVAWGLDHDVPYQHTWSCYQGNEIACGRCGTCVERIEAFAKNDAEDPIEYQDRNFWKQAVNL